MSNRENKRFVSEPKGLPLLLTADDVADILRTSRKAIYAMAEQGKLPGIVRIGRRLLFNSQDLLHWLAEKRAPSSKEVRR